jgi:glycosyltransferase involved in cell wall biosynthesis
LSSEDLRVVFLGCGPYADSERFRRDLASFSLEPHVEIVKNRIPYRDALARMAGSDVVVVLSEHLTEDGQESSIHGWTAMQVPAKLYEYLRIGRPLLAIVGDGAVKELLERTGAGTPLHSSDTEQIALALKNYYETRSTSASGVGSGAITTAAIAEFSRERLTGLLAHELDALVGEPPMPEVVEMTDADTLAR